MIDRNIDTDELVKLMCAHRAGEEGKPPVHIGAWRYHRLHHSPYSREERLALAQQYLEENALMRVFLNGCG